MTRLEARVQAEGAGPIWYPADVAWLQEWIPELQEYGTEFVQKLYSDWSEDTYDAKWFSMEFAIGFREVREFEAWINEEQA